MKLIKITDDHFVVVDNIRMFAGDYVLINCSEINIKNEIKQVIECENHKIGLPDEILVFEHDCLTNTTDAIDPLYCQKIIYSTTPLNGVKFIDISYIKNLIAVDKISMSYQDLWGFIDYVNQDSITTLKRSIAIKSYITDKFHTNQTIWNVVLDNNYLKLRNDEENISLKKEDYDEVVQLLKNICEWSTFKQHPLGQQAYQALEILNKNSI